MNKKLITSLFAGLAVFALVIGVSSVRRAFARDDKEDDFRRERGFMMMAGDHGGIDMHLENQGDEEDAEDVENISAENQSVRINASGDFIVTGAVINSVSSSTNTVNASLYGLSKDINLGNATLVGRGHRITISDIAVGDKVSAKGSYNAGTKTITVSELHDISFKSREVQDIQSKIQALLDMIHKLEDQLRSLQQ